MNLPSGKTVTLPTFGKLGQARDPFLDGVKAATKGSLEILGELGRTADSTIAYLASRLDSGTLVALRLVRLADSKHEFELDILEELDSSLPAPPAKCPQCQADLRGWGRFCTQCGADLSGVDTEGGVETPTGRMRAVQQAADGRYEILGQMTHAQGGGFVYFAREMGGTKLVALRLQRESGAEYSIGVTRVMPSMGLDLGKKG